MLRGASQVVTTAVFRGYHGQFLAGVKDWGQLFLHKACLAWAER